MPYMTAQQNTDILKHASVLSGLKNIAGRLRPPAATAAASGVRPAIPATRAPLSGAATAIDPVLPASMPVKMRRPADTVPDKLPASAMSDANLTPAQVHALQARRATRATAPAPTSASAAPRVDVAAARPRRAVAPPVQRPAATVPAQPPVAATRPAGVRNQNPTLVGQPAAGATPTTPATTPVAAAAGGAEPGTTADAAKRTWRERFDAGELDTAMLAGGAGAVGLTGLGLGYALAPGEKQAASPATRRLLEAAGEVPTNALDRLRSPTARLQRAAAQQDALHGKLPNVAAAHSPAPTAPAPDPVAAPAEVAVAAAEPSAAPKKPWLTTGKALGLGALGAAGYGAYSATREPTMTVQPSAALYHP